MNLRLAGLATLLLLAGCEAPRSSVAPPPQAMQPAPAAAAPHMAASCAGAAESLTVGDRGIGGTGVGSEAPVVADRGIGGTGVSNEGGLVRGLPGTQTVERGGGGTGIVGVLTGFRSLCVDGVEVALERPPLVTEDGIGQATETLRAGEVAAIEARGAANDLRAVSISVRHEVSGPITAIAAGGGAIEVAGQRVLMSPQTRVAADLRVGGWVAVSGLRDPGGAIHASRLDGRAPGQVLVAGVPEQADGGWQIGGLRLHLPPKLVPNGDRVVLSGELAGGALRVLQVNDDPLLPHRTSLQRLFVESYPTLEGNEIKVAEGVEAGVGPSFGASPPPDQPVVLELVNSPANVLLAVAWRQVAPVGGAGHGKPAAAPDAATPAAPASSPLMQTPALTTPVAPAVVTTAPATTTVTTAPATTTVATPATTATAATTTPAASTTTTTTAAATTTTAAANTTSSTSSSNSTSQSATSSNSTGGAAPADSGTTGKGTASGSVSGGSPPAAPPHSPPAMIGEGRQGAASPPAPSKGAGSDGGSDGPAPPGGKSPGIAGSGGTAGGTAGSTGTGTGSTGNGNNGGTGSAGTGTVPGSGAGSGTGSAGTSGPPAPTVGGVGGINQGGKKGGSDAGQNPGHGSGGKDGMNGKGGSHGMNGNGHAPAPSAPSHGANNG